MILSWCNSYIFGFIDIFLQTISIFVAIRLFTLYDLLLDYTPYYEGFHTYLLYMIHSATVSLSSVTCIHPSWLTPLCVNLPFSCHIYLNIFMRSWFLNILYTWLSFKVFCYLLILGHLYNFHLQHCNAWNYHHLYNIFEQIHSY